MHDPFITIGAVSTQEEARRRGPSLISITERSDDITSTCPNLTQD